MKIATLDLPKHSLPEATFEFWNTLYLMTRHRDIPPEQLLGLSRDEYLKAHPETLRAVALAMKEMDLKIRENREEAERATARQNDASAGGMLRYAKRLAGRSLPQPVADGLRSLLARLNGTRVPR